MIDRGLKERLTGAVVLVTLGVIFIPLFLDGPDAKSGESERRSLSLPDVESKSAGANGSQTSPPARSAAEAGPKSGSALDRSSQNSAEQVAKAGQEVSESVVPETKKAPARPAMAVAENPLSAWAVQVGSFSSQDNAERLSADLKKRGYRAFVTRLTTSNKTLYRVRVGPEQERARAELLARRLKKDGQAADVVTHP